MFKVTITGQQKHISGNVYENQTERMVNAIIDRHLEQDYVRPLFDGNSYELNNDLYIKIEAE